MDKKILVFGKNGQLALAFRELFERNGVKAEFLGHEELDLSNTAGIFSALDTRKPDIVINTAAYTAVDKAESEKEKAQLINAGAPEAMAQWCAQHNAYLIHYSTDYVFDGSGASARREEDVAGPLNHYGKTKLEGEQKIMKTGCLALIFRTSWVYSYVGNNFVKTMLRLGGEREELSIVEDQVGAPTFAPDLALRSWECLIQALKKPQFPTGIYHLAGSGEVSWYEFAKEIFTLVRARGWSGKIQSIKPIPSSAYPTPAQRPHNSRLDQSKAKSTFGVLMPDWRVSLEKCLDILVK